MVGRGEKPEGAVALCGMWGLRAPAPSGSNANSGIFDAHNRGAFNAR
jgi:hypothetical protein